MWCFLIQICYTFFPSAEKFDVVFLQEIWYRKDYNFFARCSKENYFISDYDLTSCGATNEVTNLLTVIFLLCAIQSPTTPHPQGRLDSNIE